MHPERWERVATVPLGARARAGRPQPVSGRSLRTLCRGIDRLRFGTHEQSCQLRSRLPIRLSALRPASQDTLPARAMKGKYDWYGEYLGATGRAHRIDAVPRLRP